MRVFRGGGVWHDEILALLPTLDSLIAKATAIEARLKSLFEWHDGPLVCAMQRGDLVPAQRRPSVAAKCSHGKSTSQLFSEKQRRLLASGKRSETLSRFTEN